MHRISQNSEEKRRERNKRIETILESDKGPKQITKLDSKKTRIGQMRRKDGTTVREEILDVCAEFYQDLYSSKQEGGKEPSIKSVDDAELPNKAIRGVEMPVTQMKDNKAPGNDLSSDIFKIGGDEINKQLVKLYNHILSEKKIPVKWNEAKIILLYKKRDKADIKNYRKLSFLSHAYKIFTRIIQNRIKRILDENQPREQAGFRKGFSTADHLHALKQLIEKANEYQLKLCVGYIDYEKAFDSVEHSDLFTALRKIGVSEGYMCILWRTFTQIQLQPSIWIMTYPNQFISIKVCGILPKIFTAAIEEEVFKRLNLERKLE